MRNWITIGCLLILLVSPSTATIFLNGKRCIDVRLGATPVNYIEKGGGEGQNPIRIWSRHFEAIGGITNYFTQNGTNYCLHKFLVDTDSYGSTNFLVKHMGRYGYADLHILLIGSGGDAGNSSWGSGGGAGQIIVSNYTVVSTGAYEVIIGSPDGPYGALSAVFGAVAIDGADGVSSGDGNAGANGSGGFGGYSTPGGTSTVANGHSGGSGESDFEQADPPIGPTYDTTYYWGGGGGGAGEDGHSAYVWQNVGDGGDGIDISSYIGGDSYYVAGGGGSTDYVTWTEPGSATHQCANGLGTGAEGTGGGGRGGDNSGKGYSGTVYIWYDVEQ